ncbi:hypothetical protein ACOSP7_016879 [Xanthoceras sorbifolium]
MRGAGGLLAVGVLATVSLGTRPGHEFLDVFIKATASSDSLYKPLQPAVKLEPSLLSTLLCFCRRALLLLAFSPHRVYPVVVLADSRNIAS